MSKYNDAMNKISVDEAMRHRILENIQSALSSESIQQTSKKVSPDSSRSRKIIPFPALTKIVSIAAAMLVVVVGTLSFKQNPNDTSVQGGFEIVEYQSAEELSQSAGFLINDINEWKESADSVVYQSYGENLVQITYILDEQEGYEIRKGRGAEDISGDYNTYSNTQEVNIDEKNVTLKGYEQDVNLAIWSDGEFSYSLRKIGKSLTEQEMISLVRLVIQSNS